MEQKSLQQTRQEHSGKLSDKWELYLGEYERLLSPFRDRSVNLLEIGVQNGGSLEIWSKYFPYARKFVGCDINPKCGELKYQDSRVAVVIGDANTDAVQAQILGHASPFDVMIDDGSHRSGDIIQTFCRYFPNLTEGGVFIAEDLHCSYWREFQGGLLYRYSSMEFFKRLIDIVNYEHWGMKRSRQDILKPFFSQYRISISEDLLQLIHSVEFTNSICIVRKAAPEKNRLGTRQISGSEDFVVPGLSKLNASECPTPRQGWRRFYKG